MGALTLHERRMLVEGFYAESESDLVGLWQIAKEVEEHLGISDQAREQSLMIVTDLLEKGLVVGDPPYARDGYIAWDEQSPDKVVGRIRSEWISLGRSPNIPDIAWFARKT